MIVTQIGIAVCGVAAIYLTQDERVERRKWACVLGLLGQPFWFAETIHQQQWGIVALNFLYAASWARGFRTHWRTKKAAA